MITVLRQLGLRERLAVLTLLIVCTAWAGISLFVHDGLADAAPSVGTPQQVAAAQQMLRTLPPVAGATVDAYDSACRRPKSYCLTSTTLKAPELMPEALQLLETRGATIDNQECRKVADMYPQC
nr:hypothetical protein [Pseudonocardiales bacterium]